MNTPDRTGSSWLFIVAATSLLAACGGGGGGGSPSPAPAPVPAPSPTPTPSPAPTPTPTPSPPPAINVTVTLDPATTRAISPYIYGLNAYPDSATAPPLLTFYRDGGNRWTAYNWENNASNAGSDYQYESDNYLSSSSTPAEAVRAFIAGNQANGTASLVTVQMQGLVSADESGPVSIANPPDMTRFKTVVFKKSSQTTDPFTITPSTSDAYVYMDEFVWALDQKFSGQGMFAANAATPTFIELDNEPELWNSTHLEVQGKTGITSDAYIAKTVSLTQAIKDQFPDATIVGPAHYGFQGFYSWQGELTTMTPSGANWFTDKYLAAIKAASTTYGKPLVDVYDFHWYSEATDPASGTRVTNLTGATLSDAQVQAVAQSPRSLWDPTYSETSWIRNTMGGPIQLLPRLQAKIAAANPGMKLGITEYNNGGCHHIAGTLAEADNLGIFGAQGIYAANFWPLTGGEPYCMAAFRAFRGFDGASATFGDVGVKATSGDIQSVAAYASTDSTHPGRTVFVAINRSASTAQTTFNGLAVSGTAHLYQVTASSAASQSTVAPVAAGTQAVSGSSFSVSLPPLSVTTIDVY